MDKRTIFIFFLILFSLKFFDAAIAASGILKLLCYGFMTVVIICSIPSFKKYSGGFILPVQLLCASIVISIVMAQYTWDQGFSYAATTIPYLICFSFFFLMNLKINIKDIENVVLVFGVIYAILFLFQWTHTDVVYFGFREEFKEDRGVIRVGFPGAGVLFLSCFIAITRVTSSSDNYKFVWMVYALSGLVINILQVTRQAILAMFAMYLLHFLSSVKLVYKIITAILFVVASFLFLNSENTISKGLAEQQKQDVSEGKDYIRIRAADYFLTQFTPNTISKIFGNGVYNETTRYGKTMTALGENYGFFVTDVGLVQVYIMFGLLAITAFALIFIKSLIIPLPSEYYYLKYYLWVLMATSLTSDSLISTSFLITTVLVLYCYQRLIDDKKTLETYMSNFKKKEKMLQSKLRVEGNGG